jgi:hypothetical protein
MLEAIYYVLRDGYSHRFNNEWLASA